MNKPIDEIRKMVESEVTKTAIKRIVKEKLNGKLEDAIWNQIAEALEGDSINKIIAEAAEEAITSRIPKMIKEFVSEIYITTQ